MSGKRFCGRAVRRGVALVACFAIGALVTGCAEDSAALREAYIRTLVKFEQDYLAMTPPQQAAVDELRQEFPDYNQYNSGLIINIAKATRPDVFGTPFNARQTKDFEDRLAKMRQDEQAKAVVALTQSKISSQATLNPVQADSAGDPTALDQRRNELSNGHPQY